MTVWPAPVEPRHATPRTPGRAPIVPGSLISTVARVFGDSRSARWPHPLMPHQRRIFATALQEDPYRPGRPQFRTVVVMQPRQAGKSHTGKTLMTAAALAEPAAKVWYTAQTRNDAKDFFLEDLVAALDAPGCPLRPLIRVRLSTGLEHVAFPDRSSVRLFAPTRKALHGKQGDVVVLDEAWSLTAERGRELMQAIIPIGNTRPRFQLWILSTAGTDDSGFLKPLVEDLRAGAMDPDGQVCFIEYAAHADETMDRADVLAAVAEAHPALGWTTDRDVLAAAYDELGKAEFLRAFGNVWTSAGERVIPADAWAAAQSPADPPAAGPAVLALDVTPRRDRAAIACAWTDGGAPRVAVAGSGEGTEWVAGALSAMARRLDAAVVIDEGSAAATFIAGLTGAGARVRTINGRDVARACGEFYDDVLQRRVLITPDPALEEAAAGAARRDMADAWAWGRRRSTADISPLCAATWALWGLRHAEPLPVLV